MQRALGVFNAPPVYFLGLAYALQTTTYQVSAVSDPPAWASAHPDDVLLFVVMDVVGVERIRLARAQAPRMGLITVLDRMTAEGLAVSLEAGATGSISLYASPDELVLAIAAATSGNVIVPATIARSMVRMSAEDECPPLSDAELTCLDALARGERVADLAFRIGYSEREVYRRLRRLYSRLGVEGRVQAVSLASRWGVIGGPSKTIPSSPIPYP